MRATAGPSGALYEAMPAPSSSSPSAPVRAAAGSGLTPTAFSARWEKVVPVNFYIGLSAEA